jgi:hypothetical protein
MAGGILREQPATVSTSARNLIMIFIACVDALSTNVESQSPQTHALRMA